MHGSSRCDEQEPARGRRLQVRQRGKGQVDRRQGHPPRTVRAVVLDPEGRGRDPGRARRRYWRPRMSSRPCRGHGLLHTAPPPRPGPPRRRGRASTAASGTAARIDETALPPADRHREPQARPSPPPRPARGRSRIRDRWRRRSRAPTESFRPRSIYHPSLPLEPGPRRRERGQEGEPDRRPVGRRIAARGRHGTEQGTGKPQADVPERGYRRRAPRPLLVGRRAPRSRSAPSAG